MNMNLMAQSVITAENITFSVLLSGAYSDENTLLHSHMSVELFACHSGSIEIETKGDPITLEAGDIAIVPANLRHCKRQGTSQNNWSSLLFSYKSCENHHTVDLYAILNSLCETPNVRVIKNVPMLCAEVSHMEKNADKAITNAAAFHTISLLIKLACAEGISEKEAVKSGKSHSKAQNENSNDSDSLFYIDIKLVESLNMILQSAHADGISAKKAASLLFISERQLSRIVKRLYGKTFHEVITENRLAKAEKLLVETSLSVPEIGETAGFKTTFQRTFVKHFGVSPTEYRRINGKR